MPEPASLPTDRYQRRDLALLRHAAHYGVVLNAVASKLFFSGKQAGQILRRLADEGDLVLFPRALPGGVSYARLTKSGCVRVGASEKLSRPISGHALNQAIALACYCTLAEHRRHRLRHCDLKRLYDDNAPAANVPHVLLSEAEFGRRAVLRVHFATGTVHETMKQLKRHVEEAERNSALGDSLGADGSYGFLLLSPTDAGKRSLLQAIERSGLSNLTLVIAEVSPGVEELAPFLRSLKGGPP